MPTPERHTLAATQLALMGVAWVVVGTATAVLGAPALAPLVGWDAAALTWLMLLWHKLWPLDAERTAQLAVQEDPNRAIRDVLLLAAGVASLLAIGFVVIIAHRASSPAVRGAYGGLGVLSVLLSWFVVHSVFAARYARIYYSGPGGVDFNQPAAPCYADFAYLAFTIGATFQVSDTALTSTKMRRTVLRHSLLSYLFGTFVIAVVVNLLGSLPT